MLIVRLEGGLGNQLFQYAFARSLNIRTGTDARLDAVSGFKEDVVYRRRYLLDHYSISLPAASPEEVSRARRFMDPGPAAAEKACSPYVVISEENYSFNDLSGIDFSQNIYFRGYWVTEKYFTSIGPIVKREFQLRHPLTGESVECAEKISFANSVSIHVRALHGISSDGRKIEKTMKFHGRIPRDYYERAVAYLKSECGRDITFFVFADDADYARSLLSGLGGRFCFVTHNGDERNYEDMRLMSLCRHNVIANSTFSWWGAWLNGNPDKIVIAPGRWLNDPTVDYSDIVPEDWIKM